MKKRRIKGIQMIPYGLLAGVMTEDSIEERQREVRLTEISYPKDSASGFVGEGKQRRTFIRKHSRSASIRWIRQSIGRLKFVIFR